MPRPKRASNKKVPYTDVSDKEATSESGSDFDDDDDPDKTEVPGGGKDLATSALIKDETDDMKVKIEEPKGGQNSPANLPGKIPGGLVTKGNSNLGYEKVRVGGSGQGVPFPFSSASMMGGFGGMGYPTMGSYPNMGMGGMGGPGIDAAQLLQQSELFRPVGAGVSPGAHPRSPRGQYIRQGDLQVLLSEEIHLFHSNPGGSTYQLE